MLVKTPLRKYTGKKKLWCNDHRSLDGLFLVNKFLDFPKKFLFGKFSKFSGKSRKLCFQKGPHF